MDCRNRSTFARSRLAVCGLLSALVAGCGGHATVQVGSGGSPSTGVSTGGSVSVQGGSTLATVIAIGVVIGVVRAQRELPSSTPAPELDASRRVLEQDCTKAITDWSANLKCR